MYRWLVGNRHLPPCCARSRLSTPLECRTPQVAAELAQSQRVYDEEGTANREVAAIHLNIDTFIYVLSSSFYESYFRHLERPPV